MNDALFMTIAGLFFGGFAFVGAYFGANLALKLWKFKIKYDKEKNEIVVESENKLHEAIKGKVSDKVEFLSEADQPELEEMEKPKKLKKFMSKFSKPGK